MNWNGVTYRVYIVKFKKKAKYKSTYSMLSFCKKGKTKYLYSWTSVQKRYTEKGKWETNEIGYP